MANIEREDGNSLHDVEISHALKGLAEIRALSEETGREETTASDLLLNELSEELKQVHEETVTHQTSEKTYGRENRILERRRTRGIGRRLLGHGH
jgi:nucleoid-associated protein YejK